MTGVRLHDRVCIWQQCHDGAPGWIALTASQRSDLARCPRGAAGSTWCCGPGSCCGRGGGTANARIAAWVGVHEDTVRKWRRGSPGAGLATGRSAPVGPAAAVHCGPGRPGQGAGLHPAARDRVAVVALVVRGAGRQAIDRGLAEDRPSTVRRWLAADALKPWQYRSWIFIATPTSHAKAARVLDLYDRSGTATPLGPDDYVITADEKSTPGPRRCHPGLPAGPGRTRG